MNRQQRIKKRSRDNLFGSEPDPEVRIRQLEREKAILEGFLNWTYGFVQRLDPEVVPDTISSRLRSKVQSTQNDLKRARPKGEGGCSGC